jgi:hypothetical protein
VKKGSNVSSFVRRAPYRRWLAVLPPAVACGEFEHGGMLALFTSASRSI